MFKVKVLTVGKTRESWLTEAIAEYEKRLHGKLSIEWAIAKDDAQLIQWSELEPQLILLTPDGTLFTSEEFSRKIMALFIQNGSRLVFVIGGADGIPANLKGLRMSLSPLTFTHQMTRLILIEQIYRALEIERGSKYHK